MHNHLDSDRLYAIEPRNTKLFVDLLIAQSCLPPQSTTVPIVRRAYWSSIWKTGLLPLLVDYLPYILLPRHTRVTRVSHVRLRAPVLLHDAVPLISVFLDSSFSLVVYFALCLLNDVHHACKFASILELLITTATCSNSIIL